MATNLFVGGVRIKGDARLRRGLKELARIGTKKKDVHSTMAITVERWILKNFDEEGGKLKGRPWKKSERAKRESGKTLLDTGLLRRSTNSKVTQRSARVGLSKDYAPKHNFGIGVIQRRILPKESEVIDDLVRQVNLLVEKKIRRLF